MEVVSEDHSFLLVLRDIVHGHVVALIRRDEAILLTIEDDILQAAPVGYCALRVLVVVCRHRLEVDIEAELAHRGDIRTELHRRVLVPVGHMRSEGFDGEELRHGPLDVKALERIGIVAGPQLTEIFQSSIVAACTTTGAEHHLKLRVLVVDAVEDLVEATHVVDIQVTLLLFLIRREDIRERRVAVPLEVDDVGVLCHELVDDREHIVLHLWVGEVEHKLIAIIISLAVRLFNDPVLVLLIEFTLRVDHLRLNPQSELHAGFLSCLRQSENAAGQFRARRLPIT